MLPGRGRVVFREFPNFSLSKLRMLVAPRKSLGEASLKESPFSTTGGSSRSVTTGEAINRLLNIFFSARIFAIFG